MTEKCPFTWDEYHELSGMEKQKYYRRFQKWMKLQRLKDRKEWRKEAGKSYRLKKKHGKN